MKHMDAWRSQGGYLGDGGSLCKQRGQGLRSRLSSQELTIAHQVQLCAVSGCLSPIRLAIALLNFVKNQGSQLPGSETP